MKTFCKRPTSNFWNKNKKQSIHFLSILWWGKILSGQHPIFKPNKNLFLCRKFWLRPWHKTCRQFSQTLFINICLKMHFKYCVLNLPFCVDKSLTDLSLLLQSIKFKHIMHILQLCAQNIWSNNFWEKSISVDFCEKFYSDGVHCFQGRER